MDLDAIADELYGLPVADFTRARDARVAALRREKHRELAAAVKALRRPSASAEAVNRLVRSQPGVAAQLIALGDQLRSAQAHLSGGDIRTLGRRRREVVSALGRSVRELARSHDRPLGPAAEREVTATLEAALADPAAATAVATGRLTRALEHSGLGPVEIEGVVGGPAVGPDGTGAAPPAGADAVTGDGPGAAGGAGAAEVSDDAGASAAAEAARVRAAAEAARVRAAAEAAQVRAAAEAGAAADEADLAVATLTADLETAMQRAAEARALADDLEGRTMAARAASDVAAAESERARAELERAAAVAARLRRDADAAHRAVHDAGPGG